MKKKKRMNPWFYAIFWLSRQKLAKLASLDEEFFLLRLVRFVAATVAGPAIGPPPRT